MATPANAGIGKAIILNMRDYYNLLGVRFAAKPEEIRTAFRRMAKQAHPDAHPHLTGPEKEAMQRQFILLAQAYETLSDPPKRKEYDQVWRARKQAQQAAQQQTDRKERAAERNRTARAAAGRTRSTGPRPGARPRPAARPQPPPEPAPEVDDMLGEVEELLNQFGVDMRNQFGAMLESMLNWAMGMFMEAMQSLEGESQKTGAAEGPSASGSNRPPGRPSPDAQRTTPRRGYVPKATEKDLEAELAALKKQVHSAVDKAKREREETVEEELARIKAATRSKPQP